MSFGEIEKQEMSDALDVAELRAGNRDMIRRDLRGENFSGSNFTDVDFSKSHLENCNFDNANLKNGVFSGVHSLFLSAVRANLSSATAISTAFSSVNFTECDLRKSNFSRSHFAKVNFSGADFRGADFRFAVFNDGCNFDRSISDDNTLFDGASILRSLARSEVFRFYKVERGVLVRVDQIDNSLKAEGVSHLNLVGQEISVLTQRLDDVLVLISEIKLKFSEFDHTPGIGHNNPPSISPLSENELSDISENISAIKNEISRKESSIELIESKNTKLKEFSSKIIRWMTDKFELAINEFAKEFGKRAADWKIYIGSYVILSGKIDEILGSIGPILSKISLH